MPVFRLSSNIKFPPPELAEENGLLAVGGDLSVQRLLEAYRTGIFPWYSAGDPILWWTPAPRLVLFPNEFHTPKRLARVIRKQVFSLTADTAFKDIIEKCARFRGTNREETWITPEMQNAYCRLHERGYAHSIECWHEGSLAGGLYGIALDQVFFGESMYSQVKDASKVALHALVRHAEITGIKIIDCQIRTEHLATFGAREISREHFQEILKKYIRSDYPQKKMAPAQYQQGGDWPCRRLPGRKKIMKSAYCYTPIQRGTVNLLTKPFFQIKVWRMNRTARSGTIFFP